ncbi:S24 family peptidase [Pseudahrensia aquimaris]|uniref:S24 family peptidase n=1 Tax=Pseudahrensia aquimaris TaxID=744461 RepID=A0ABW3FK38_9HYPH
MFSHARVWAAIDALAERNKMSVSRLARTAGLDPTTFNKSKREGADGRLRWPSTESLSKIMAATNTDIDTFTALINGAVPSKVDALKALVAQATTPPVYSLPPSVPLLGMAEAGAGGYFDDGGYPSGQGWDEVNLPRPDGENIYALEISGDSMMPLYRDGDTIIVSPGEKVRKGDRVVVKTLEGEVMAKVLARKTVKTIELDSLNPAHPKRVLDMSDVEWVARIVWASQ